MEVSRLQFFLGAMEIFLSMLQQLLLLLADVEEERQRNLAILFLLSRRRGPRAAIHRRRAGIRNWLATRPRDPRWWVRPRTLTDRTWWTSEVLQRWGDDQWLNYFRMSKATLMEIADLLRPHLQRQRTIMRDPISVEMRVAMTVWWLSTPLNYRKTALQFGVGETTVSDAVIEVCRLVERFLLPITVGIGNYREVMEGFRQMGFPQCIGALDRTHIPIRTPTGRGDESISRRDRYSVLLQGTTDHLGKFIDIEVGFSGRTDDTQVFTHSALYQAMEANRFVPENPTISVDGTTVGPVILGDAAYPLARWLMKPYDGQLDMDKMTYNRVFNRCHNVVERAFERLKTRWSCLSCPLTVREENFVSIISTCVVLHNICEARGHTLPQNIDPPLPVHVAVVPFEAPQHFNSRHLREGENVRAAITTLLKSQ